MIIPPSINENEIGQIEPGTLVPYNSNKNEYVREFLNVKPWLCPSCQCKNFGRNERCANFRCKNPRPGDFKLEPRE